MSKIINLQGTYKITGSYLIHSTGAPKLLITSRAQIKGKKTVNFLLDKTDNKGAYISSLYYVSTDTGIDTFNFDYQGVRYILQQNKTDNKAEIKQG